MEENFSSPEKIYKLVTTLWFNVADNKMKGRGHCGISGPSGDPTDEYHTIDIGYLEGAKRAITEIIEKLKQDGISILNKNKL